MSDSSGDEITRILLAIEEAGGVLPPKPDHDSTRRRRVAPSLYLDRSAVALPIPTAALPRPKVSTSLEPAPGSV